MTTTDPLLELFEPLKRDFASLTLDQFTDAMNRGESKRFEFWRAVRHTPFAGVYSELADHRHTAANNSMPHSLRTQAFEQLKYALDKTIAALRTGALSIPRKRLRQEVVNAVSDPKIRQLCMELNATPDEHVLALAQLIGETLKWVLWYKAKQEGTSLKEDGALKPLLDEAIAKSYLTSKASKRFCNGSA